MHLLPLHRALTLERRERGQEEKFLSFGYVMIEICGWCWGFCSAGKWSMKLPKRWARARPCTFLQRVPLAAIHAQEGSVRIDTAVDTHTKVVRFPTLIEIEFEILYVPQKSVEFHIAFFISRSLFRLESKALIPFPQTIG
jgi:hypothetical protein